MGNMFAKLFSGLFGKREVRFLMVGLDAAGKTSILYKLKLGKTFTPLPTIGLNVETFEYRNISFTVWDLCSHEKMRPLWRHYYPSSQGVIFVVDTNDNERLDEAKDVLNHCLNEEELEDVAIIVFANKQDLPNALPCSKLAERLDLNSIRKHNWHIQATSAITGEGLYEGLDWLSDQLQSQ